MSIKTNTFRQMLGRPLNTHNFFISIPTMSDVELLVSSTTFPTEKLGSKTLFYQGEAINFPTMPQRGGDWSCTLSEGEYAKVYRSASLEYKTNFLQDLGVLNSWAFLDKFDIVVGSKPLSEGKRSVWSEIVSRTSALSPSGSSVSSVIRSVGNIGSLFSKDTSLFSVKLKGCFFLGIEPVSLSAGTPTTSWSWVLTFKYDSLDFSESRGQKSPNVSHELPQPFVFNE